MKENPTFVVKPNSDEVKGAVFPNIILGNIKSGAFCKSADSVDAHITCPIKSAQYGKLKFTKILSEYIYLVNASSRVSMSRLLTGFLTPNSKPP